ncbi:MAG: metallophosphoesterase [Pleurocapsa sp.]
MAFIITEPLKIERINIAIANLPESLAGTKIVQLSDLHYDGVHLSNRLLAQAIAASNRENPDLVVITGDFITNDPNPIKQLASKLKGLNSKIGVYGCLGNHDVLNAASKPIILEALAEAKIKILWNEVIYPFADSLALVGLADFWSPEFEPAPVLESIASEIPRLVLSHNPDSAKILKRWRVDLQLSGHTHGGQIVIPHYGPVFSLLPKISKFVPRCLRRHIPYLRDCSQVVKRWQWSEGWHQVGTNQLYINRGLASYAPGRFCCPPELTVITLEPSH